MLFSGTSDPTPGRSKNCPLVLLPIQPRCQQEESICGTQLTKSWEGSVDGINPSSIRYHVRKQKSVEMLDNRTSTLQISKLKDCIAKKEILGRGQEGVIYRCQLQGDLCDEKCSHLGKVLAVKETVKYFGMTPNYKYLNSASCTPIVPITLTSLQARRRLMRRLCAIECENLCRHYCYLESDHHCWILMERIRGEPLSGFPLSEVLARELFRQLITGLSSLHNYEIIHRDIKPDNMLVTGIDSKRPKLKIIDVSSGCRTEDAHLLNQAGTPAYL
eukprot:GHVU01155873.1.p1 GENE.GHVU01155873.1~~GHVU01155873.1.p1  ORF type:complete len:274 (-),score=15.85 GHVU01155873.1:1055-1876(-)